MAERVATIDALDRITKPLAATVKRLVPRGPLKDLLSGTWLGHPVHPRLTDIPTDSFTSAAVLDRSAASADSQHLTRSSPAGSHPPDRQPRRARPAAPTLRAPVRGVAKPPIERAAMRIECAECGVVEHGRRVVSCPNARCCCSPIPIDRGDDGCDEPDTSG